MAKKISKIDRPVFGLASEAYKKFRPTYPNRLFEELFSAVAPYGFKSALDVGAGTGLSTEGLLERFEKVTLLEPDAQLIKHVQTDKFHSIINQNIEDYTFGEEDYFNLVTFGNAFYWTDGAKVLTKLSKKASVIAAYRYDFPKIMNTANKVLQNHLGLYWDTFRHERLRNTQYTLDCFKSTPLFNSITLSTVPYIKHLTAEAFVGFITSTSYASSYLRSLKNEKEAANYIAEFLQEIKSVSNTDTMDIDFSLELVIGITKK